MYLKFKDCTKILYNLYEEVYGDLKTPTKEEVNRITHLASCHLYPEEIWAISNEVIFVTDEPYLSRIGTIRERKIPKREFILLVVMPAYRCLHDKEELVFNDELDKFALKCNFLKGICNGKECFNEWLCHEGESIRTKDAEKIVENIKNFFALRNC